MISNQFGKYTEMGTDLRSDAVIDCVMSVGRYGIWNVCYWVILYFQFLDIIFVYNVKDEQFPHNRELTLLIFDFFPSIDF